MRKLILALTAAATLLAPAAAMADPGWRHNNHNSNGWRGHPPQVRYIETARPGWYDPHYRPVRIAVPARPVYVAPPPRPVYVAPRPVYYAPPPIWSVGFYFN